MKRYLLLIIASLGIASCSVRSYSYYTFPSDSVSCLYDEGQARICFFPSISSSLSTDGEIVFVIHNGTSLPITVDSLDLTLASDSSDPVVIPHKAVHAEWDFYGRAHDDGLSDCTRKTFADLASDFKTVQQDTNKHDLRIAYRYQLDIPNAAPELRMHLRMQVQVHGDIMKIDRNYTFVKQHASYIVYLRD